VRALRLRHAAVRSSGSPVLDEMEAEFRRAAEAAGFSAEPGPVDLAAVLVLTGGTERKILEASQGAKLVLLFYHDSYNSLAAASEAASLLQASGVGVQLYDFGSARQVLAQAARAAEAVEELKGVKITSFGGPSEWLVYSTGEGDLLGASVEVVPLEDLAKEAEGAEPEQMPGQPSRLEGVSGEQVERALRLASAMRRLSEGPLTVRCFDLLRIYGVTPCLALAALNSKGLIAGCEGDVPSLLTMYILSKLSGRPAWMGNVTPGPAGTLAIAHCTFPLSEASSFELTTHFETDRPVGVRAYVREGLRATLAKYDPRNRTLRAIRAEVALGRPFTRACRTQVAFRVSERALELTLSRPMGAHYAVVFDDVVPGLRAFASLEGLRLEEA